MIREVFGRIDAQAGLPAVMETVERWRPDVVLRESAELASLAAAERAGVPHVHVCIGMHEVGDQLRRRGRRAAGGAGPAGRARRRAGRPRRWRPRPCSARCPRPSTTPLARSRPRPRRTCASTSPHPRRAPRPCPTVGRPRPAAGLRDVRLGHRVARPLRRRCSARRWTRLADLDARVLMTVGRRLDPADLGPWPANARVEQWWPRRDVLAHAAAMLGHGGFGTTMGALAAGVPQVVVPIFTFDQVVNGRARRRRRRRHRGPDGTRRRSPRGVRRGTAPARRPVVRRGGARRRRRDRRAAAPPDAVPRAGAPRRLTGVDASAG